MKPPLKVIYSRWEARIDLCDFLLQNTTKFFQPGSIRRNDVEISSKPKITPLSIELALSILKQAGISSPNGAGMRERTQLRPQQAELVGRNRMRAVRNIMKLI